MRNAGGRSAGLLRGGLFVSACVSVATVSGVTVLVPDSATSDCAGGVLLTWSEYQTATQVPADLSALVTSASLSADYAFGFSAVGIGFVLSFPIAIALKALKLA